MQTQTKEPSVEVIINKLSDGSETFDVRFVRQGEAILIPMRDEKSALSLHNTISAEIESGRIL